METTLKKQITVNAPASAVWRILVNDELNRIWYAEFSGGSHAITDWKKGSRVTFTDSTCNGITGTIAENTENELLSISFDGIVNDDVIDFESGNAKAIVGSRETYTLTEGNNQTTLFVETDMSEEYFDMMSEAWDRALQQIKKLAEQ